jgi:hypothetical protein
MVNSVLWHEARSSRAIRSWLDLARLATLGIVLFALLLQRPGSLLIPGAVAIIASVFVTLSLVNSVLIIAAMRWENRARAWRHVVAPLLLGLFLSLLEVGSIALVRSWLDDRIVWFLLPSVA